MPRRLEGVGVRRRAEAWVRTLLIPDLADGDDEHGVDGQDQGHGPESQAGAQHTPAAFAPARPDPYRRRHGHTRPGVRDSEERGGEGENQGHSPPGPPAAHGQDGQDQRQRERQVVREHLRGVEGPVEPEDLAEVRNGHGNPEPQYPDASHIVGPGSRQCDRGQPSGGGSDGADDHGPQAAMADELGEQDVH